MYEFNVKYWFHDFQNKNFSDFLDEIEFFIKEKPIFTQKKNWRSVVCSDFMAVKLCPPAFWKILSRSSRQVLFPDPPSFIMKQKA
jgi:hypothetical protein